MNAKVYNLSGNDWVTMVSDAKKPLLNQVFNAVPDFNVVAQSKGGHDDGFESVYFHKKELKENLSVKQKRQKKKKHSKRKRMAPPPPVSMIRRANGDIERTYFAPYTTSCFQYNNLYKMNVMPKYLNGTIASEMKRVPKEYWRCKYYSPTPFVASCVTRNTHNLVLLKQETFAKIKAAILPFKSDELNDQSINSLRSIKRSIEKHWKL